MQVPALTIIFIFLNILIGIVIPLVMFIFLKKKYNCNPAFFGAGCAVFLLFVMILEGVVNNLFINHTPIGQTIKDNTWMLAVYGGLAAALFEEFGRFVAFKTVLKNKMANDKDAFMYGAGHGGIEAVMILSLSFVNYAIYAVLVNTGGISLLTGSLSGENLDAFNKIIEGLCTGNPYLMLLAPMERVAAVAAHMAFSVLVFYGVKYSKPVLMGCAVLFHFALDALSVIASGKVDNTLCVELIVYAIVAIIIILTYFIVRFSIKGAYAEVESD